LQVDAQQTCGPHRLQGAVVGHGVLTRGHHGPLVVMPRVAADGPVDGATGGVGVALHHRVVDLGDGALAESTLQHRVGHCALGHHHQPGGAHVQALDDALALRGTGGGYSVPGGGQRTDHGGTVPTRAGVGGHPHGFVDDDDVFVLVPDHHAWHRLG